MKFKFRLKWDGKYVAGVSKVSALTRTTQLITHRTGGDPTTSRPLPGQSEFAAIILERGVTHDVAFGQCPNKVWNYHSSTIEDQQGGAGNQSVALQDFRKYIALEVYNESKLKVMAYNIIAAGRRSSLRCPRCTRTAMRLLSSRSCWRMKAGNAIRRSPSRPSLALGYPRDKHP